MSTEKLRQRLSQIQSYLSEAETMKLWPINEVDTERLVVEPILEALGYGPLDYRKRAQGVGADFPDYTILPISERRWCLEVKEWDARLEERFERQCVNYANNNGAQWAVLTNGRVWWIYNTRAPGNLKEMRAYEVKNIFDFKEAVEILLHLSRESVEGGELDREYRSREIRSTVMAFLNSGDKALVRVIQRGVAQQLDRHITTEDVEDALLNILSGTPVEAPVPVPPKEKESQETSVASYFTLKELVEFLKNNTGIKPARLVMPDSIEKPADSWRDLAEQVVQWLLDQDTSPTLPFTGTERGDNYFLNLEPLHSTGEPMRAYRVFETANGPIFMDLHRSAINILGRLVALCEVVDQSPEMFKVSLLEE